MRGRRRGGDRGDVAGQQGAAGGHRLEHHVGQPVAVAVAASTTDGTTTTSAGGVEGGQLGVGEPAEQLDAAAEPDVGRRRASPGWPRCGAVADDAQTDRRAGGGPSTRSDEALLLDEPADGEQRDVRLAVRRGSGSGRASTPWARRRGRRRWRRCWRPRRRCRRRRRRGGARAARPARRGDLAHVEGVDAEAERRAGEAPRPARRPRPAGGRSSRGRRRGRARPCAWRRRRPARRRAGLPGARRSGRASHHRAGAGSGRPPWWRTPRRATRRGAGPAVRSGRRSPTRAASRRRPPRCRRAAGRLPVVDGPLHAGPASDAALGGVPLADAEAVARAGRANGRRRALVAPWFEHDVGRSLLVQHRVLLEYRPGSWLRVQLAVDTPDGAGAAGVVQPEAGAAVSVVAIPTIPGLPVLAGDTPRGRCRPARLGAGPPGGARAAASR